MALIYTGESGKISVNGRPLKHGVEITDPQEIADLTGQEDFEGSSASEAAEPEGEEEE